MRPCDTVECCPGTGAGARPGMVASASPGSDLDAHACEAGRDCAVFSTEGVTWIGIWIWTGTRSGTAILTEADGDSQEDVWGVTPDEKSVSRKHRCRVACGQDLARTNARLSDGGVTAFSHHCRGGIESVTLSDRQTYDVEGMGICSHVCAGSATLRN